MTPMGPMVTPPKSKNSSDLAHYFLGEHMFLFFVYLIFSVLSLLLFASQGARASLPPLLPPSPVFMDFSHPALPHCRVVPCLCLACCLSTLLSRCPADSAAQRFAVGSCRLAVQQNNPVVGTQSCCQVGLPPPSLLSRLPIPPRPAPL